MMMQDGSAKPLLSITTDGLWLSITRQLKIDNDIDGIADSLQIIFRDSSSRLENELTAQILLSPHPTLKKGHFCS